jgi:hypothetical protein
LGSSGNLPISYMTWVDGAADKRAGARGLMGIDALANGVGALLLLVFAATVGRRWIAAGRDSSTHPVLSSSKD